MQIDYEKMKRYASLSDEALWSEIVALAAGRGIRMPKTVPTHEDMERIREILTGRENIRLSDAARLVNEYKNKYGGES